MVIFLLFLSSSIKLTFCPLGNGRGISNGNTKLLNCLENALNKEGVPDLDD